MSRLDCASKRAGAACCNCSGRAGGAFASGRAPCPWVFSQGQAQHKHKPVQAQACCNRRAAGGAICPGHAPDWGMPFSVSSVSMRACRRCGRQASGACDTGVAGPRSLMCSRPDQVRSRAGAACCDGGGQAGGARAARVAGRVAGAGAGADQRHCGVTAARAAA